MKIVVGFVPTQEGRAALEAAIVEARAHRGHLTVVHSRRPSAPLDDPAELSAQRDLDDIDARLTAAAIAHSVREYRGESVVEDLIRAAADDDADLIVIGIRPRTPAGKFFFGSNAQEVLLKSRCPVLAVKSGPSLPDD